MQSTTMPTIVCCVIKILSICVVFLLHSNNITYAATPKAPSEQSEEKKKVESTLARCSAFFSYKYKCAIEGYEYNAREAKGDAVIAYIGLISQTNSEIAIKEVMNYKKIIGSIINEDCSNLFMLENELGKNCDEINIIILKKNGIDVPPPSK